MPTKSKPVTAQSTNTVPVLYLPHLLKIDEFNAFVFNKLMIYPGLNWIATEVWEQMQSHPIVKFKIEPGALREADLSKEEDRVHAVRGTWELPTLRSQAQTEVSPLVQEEIAAQIKRLDEAKFPSVWRNNVAGECKSDYLIQCGPRIWRNAYSLPSEFDLQHNNFWYPQNRPIPA